MSLLSLLGNVKETIQENYTSEKLFNAADKCLYDALDIVIQTTTLFEECLAIYLATRTRKQIFNSYNQKHAEKLLFRFYFADIAEKQSLVRRMKLNRDLLALPVRVMMDCQAAYCKSVTTGTQHHVEIRRALHCRDVSRDISLELLHVSSYGSTFFDMRSAILEKYYRLIVTNIGKMDPKVKEKVDLESIATEYYAASLKAFAKFDIMSGPFTSYLKGWFKNAKGQIFNDEVGVAYLIPSNLRFKVANGQASVSNFSVELDSCEEVGKESEVDLKQSEDTEAIAQIVEMFDSTGIYRLLNEMELADAETVVVNKIS
jgi:hypothetical protein